jgi:hypothetical protein
MCQRVFIVQCLKRSEKNKAVWWREDADGYTDIEGLAGRYSAIELEQCAGNRGDWVAHPLWIRCQARLEGRWECDD